MNLSDAGQVWSCGVQVAGMEAQGPAGRELRKRLVTRLRREGIALGIPARLIRENSDPGQNSDRAQNPAPGTDPKA